MNRPTSILLEIGPPLTVILAVPCCLLAFHLGIIVKGNRMAEQNIADLAELQSEASHLRNLNWLLSRQLERERGAEQLNPSKP